MLYIWHEDSKDSAATEFWCLLSEFIKEIKNIRIEGFNGNENLKRHLEDVKNINLEDYYIVFVDAAYDNPKALKVYESVVNIADKYKNIYVSDLYCFEFLLLSFQHLDVWLSVRNKRFWEVRNELIKAVNEGIESWEKSDILKKFIEDYNIHRTKISKGKKVNLKITFEYLTAILLSQLSNNAYGDFEIGKTKLGSCWQTSCIKDKERNCSKCKIRIYNKTQKEKANNLWNCTKAKSIILKAKLFFINKQRK